MFFVERFPFFGGSLFEGFTVYTCMLCIHMLYVAVDTAKKAYLLLYNGVQWAGFILIVMSLLKCLTKGRGVSIYFTVIRVVC